MSIYYKYINKKKNIKCKKYLDILRTGYEIKINYIIIEEGRTQNKIFTGTCIAIHKNNISSTIKVRKIDTNNKTRYDKIFPIYSPLIKYIDIIKKKRYKKSKLYHI